MADLAEFLPTVAKSDFQERLAILIVYVTLMMLNLIVG